MKKRIRSNKIRLKKSELPRPRIRWERKPITHVKESGKVYKRSVEKLKTRKAIKNEKEKG